MFPHPVWEVENAPLDIVPGFIYSGAQQAGSVLKYGLGTIGHVLPSQVIHPDIVNYTYEINLAIINTKLTEIPEQFHLSFTQAMNNVDAKESYFDKGVALFDLAGHLAAIFAPELQVAKAQVPGKSVGSGTGWLEGKSTSTGKVAPSTDSWSHGFRNDPKQNATRHWNDHGKQFPQLKSEAQYIQAANKFVNNPPTGTLTKVRANGETVFYHPETNTFAVKTPDGVPKTMFKREKDGLEYFNRQ